MTLTENQSDRGPVVELLDSLRKIGTSNTASSLAILEGMVNYLLSQAKSEAEYGCRLRFMLDFEMIVDVLENRAYCDVMKRCLNAARLPGGSKLILLRGTRIEAEAYIKYKIRELSELRPAAHAVERARKDLLYEGVFADKDWSLAKKSLEHHLKHVETRTALEVLSEILTYCCDAFSSLNIGREAQWVDYQEKKSYEKQLKTWQKNNPRESVRSARADRVDSENLAVIHKMNSHQKEKRLCAAMVTATRPVLEVGKGDGGGRTDVQNPFVLELHQTLDRSYKSPAARIGFLDQCKVEIAQFAAALDTFEYGDKEAFGIQRREILQLMGICKRIGTLGSNFGQLASIVCGSSASVEANWFTTPPAVRQETESLTVSGVNRSISKARCILSQVVKGAETLRLIDGQWLAEVTIPNGIEYRLQTNTPPATITLDRFADFYSMYWDTDLTIADVVDALARMSLEAKVCEIKSFVALLANGEEKELAVRLNHAVADTRNIVAQSRIHAICATSDEADFYFEMPKPSSLWEDEQETVKGCTCAILATYGGIELPAKFFEETCSCYLEKREFADLFKEKIKPLSGRQNQTR